MGNCLKRERNMEWDGEDDWKSLTLKHSQLGNRIIDAVENCTGGVGCGNVEKQRLLSEDDGFSYSAAAGNCTGSRHLVKFKITKKELEELVRRDMEDGLSLEEFLSSLFNTCNYHCRMDHHRTWRPVLQSIPEVN